MENTARHYETKADPAKELEEAVARKLCQVAGLDPDSRHYPVNPSHHDIYWPMWQIFREGAQEIIAMVKRNERPLT